MDITIQPGLLQGDVSIIPSKSQAHRLLICAAFADGPTTLTCPQTNEDIQATAACLNALGAKIQRTDDGYQVYPVSALPEKAELPCGESGSTLRFLLPVVGALGVDALFHMQSRLPQRPLSPLWEEMERMGCQLSRPTADTLRCTGKLNSGTYNIDGSISSQYVSGLLFAAALLPGDSEIMIHGTLESAPYVDMTRQALQQFGCITNGYRICGNQQLHSPGSIHVEGDWSNGAFFLAANALGSRVSIHGLNLQSYQGDRLITEILPKMDRFTTISAANIPDLIPVLAVTAAAKAGAVFTEIRRLRLKESDRVASVIAMLRALDIHAEATENTFTVHPGVFRPGKVDTANDHRIAMSAAIAATIATGPVTILGCQCVNKSFPSFWEEYARLGGQYEQYIR